MAYIASAFTAGQTLTAASMEDLRGNANAGHNVFTNEAARDAAITAPTEGMMAYLTAPTVPAATGATTAVPTGITTIYNGSAWVCVTPVGGSSQTSGTTTSTSFVTTLTGDGTAISTTLATGTTAFVSFSVTCNVNTAAQVISNISVSGATTLAAATATGTYVGVASANITVTRTQILTGLTAGTNTFTLNYLTQGGTATFVNRALVVQGIA